VSRPRHFVAALVALFCWHSSSAAEPSGYVVLTTDYVFRGVTQSNGNPALQLGGDVAFDSGIYLGAWGSTIDIDNGSGRQRDFEIIYYLGYRHDLSQAFSIGGNLLAYTYPGAQGDVDYDYQEVALFVNFLDRVWLEYSYSPDIYSSGQSTNNFELFTEWPLSNEFSLGAGLGYYDVSNLSGDSYYYWQLGVSRPIGRIELDLRYHDTSRWVPVVSNAKRAGARYVLSARLQF